MPKTPLILAVSTKLYRLMLTFYPRSFQAEFGEEMSADCSGMLADALQRRGRLGVVVAWFHLLGDFFSSVVYQHWITLAGRLTMLGRTLSTHWLLGTAFSVLAVVVVVIAASPSPELESPEVRTRFLNDQCVLQVFEVDLSQFPPGAQVAGMKTVKFSEMSDLSFPVVSWPGGEFPSIGQ